jgi:hypothetical protein
MKGDAPDQSSRARNPIIVQESPLETIRGCPEIIPANVGLGSGDLAESPAQQAPSARFHALKPGFGKTWEEDLKGLVDFPPFPLSRSL